MTHSDSPDFEFDISDLEVEGNDPSASEPRTNASKAESEPLSGKGAQLTDDEEVEQKSVSNKLAEDDDSELSGFDIDSLPDAFSAAPSSSADSPVADAQGSEPGEETADGEAGLQPVQPMESGAEGRSMREMGEDDLGADVFAEIDGEDEAASFEDVLEDLMEQVDDFEAGGFVDLDEEADREAARGEAEDGIFGLEDPDDSLGQSVDPNAESPKAKPPESEAPPAVQDVPKAETEPRPKLPLDFEIPADPVAEEQPAQPDDERAAEEPEEAFGSTIESEAPVAESESVGEGVPALADVETGQDALETDDLADEVVSAYEALEDAGVESDLDDEEIETDETVNVVDESPVLVDDESDERAIEDAPESASEVFEDAIEEGLESNEVALDETEEIGEPAAADSEPGLALLDEEEEVAQPSEQEAEDGVGPSSQGIDEVVDEEDDEVVSMPSAEDLLMRAGNLLNGEDKPADAASSMLSELHDEVEEDEAVETASPQDLMAEAAEPEDEDVSMPDPADMMKVATGGLIPADEDESDDTAAEGTAPVSGNVVDRAGDLPPPPPAPVEIIDDDPMDEDETAPEPLAEMEPLDAEHESDQLQDPFESEISLDDFDESFDGSDDMSDVFPDELDIAGGFEDSSDLAGSTNGGGQKIVAMPKRGLLWRVTHSIVVAAAVFAIAAGWVFSIWKQEIMEFVDGRDIDGSALVMQIRQIGSHALQDFDEYDLYRMQWVDSAVRRVSENEIRIHALVGAQLRENLYEQVFDSELKTKFGYDDAALSEAIDYAGDHYPEEIGRYPEKPWSNLYRLSAAKSEVLPLRIAYRLTREDAKSDWELTGIKARGYEKEEIEWPEGQPVSSFGDRAYDVDSVAFEQVLADYREKTAAYVASISNLRHAADEKLATLHLENQKRRERVMMSLSQGSFFRGVAIMGEDAATAKDVTMVITEIREKGALVKGVFQMDKRTDDYSKFFVGSVDFEAEANGSEQGVLNLRTVAMSDAPADDSESAFFDPQTVSRMRLETDGFRLEGDMRDLSLRLTRNM